MNASLRPAYIEKIDQRGDFDVWIVDGSYIRGHIDEEFTNFGRYTGLLKLFQFDCLTIYQ